MELPDLDAVFERAESCSGARSIVFKDNSLAHLGRLLRLTRLELGMGLRQAARDARMDPGQLWRVEAGQDGKLSTYLRLIELHGCRVSLAVTFPTPMSARWLAVNLRQREWEDGRWHRSRERRWANVRARRPRPAPPCP